MVCNAAVDLQLLRESTTGLQEVGSKYRIRNPNWPPYFCIQGDWEGEDYLQPRSNVHSWYQDHKSPVMSLVPHRKDIRLLILSCFLVGGAKL